MSNTAGTVTLTLSRSDRDLIREHGYPFPRIQAVLDAVPATVDVTEVTCDAYDTELLLGDLARSINRCSDEVLQDRLNELYECIELDAGV